MKVAVIPARGGSKRIPLKNIRVFFGKPMIAHSIVRAQESGVFDRIIVSTDNEDVAEIATKYGAEVPFLRPAELSDDYTGTTPVVAHAIEQLQAVGGGLITAVCCIYATAPFVQCEDLVRGLIELESGQWKYVFSATTYQSPIFRSFRKNELGKIEMIFPKHFQTRSQDLPDIFHDAGQFYWGLPDAWKSNVRIFGADSEIIHIPHWRVQDIDTIDDWTRAEVIMEMLRNHQPLALAT
jgi:pseudaminic acid cytidylyltransferase